MNARLLPFGRLIAEGIEPSFQYDLEKKHNNTRQAANRRPETGKSESICQRRTATMDVTRETVPQLLEARTFTERMS